MGWISHNKWYCTGTIDSGGITLDSSNSESGTAPTGLDEYGTAIYGTATYGPTARYEGEYQSTVEFNRLSWTATGDAGDIKYQYATSDDGVTYSDWSTETDAIGSTTLEIDEEYFKIRFTFYSTTWGDSDSVEITNIGIDFEPFVKNTLIDADDVNTNIWYVAQGSWLPMGGTELEYTTTVYNLGSDSYEWAGVYVTNVNMTGILDGTFNLISETDITATTGRVEISGLDGNTDEIYILYMRMVNDIATSSAFTLFFNGDSATNYGYQYFAGTDTTTSAARGTTQTGIPIGEISNDTATTQLCYTESWIYAKSGYERTLLSSQNRRASGTYVAQTMELAGIWNDTSSTISSIQITASTSTAIGVGSNIQLWVKR